MYRYNVITEELYGEHTGSYTTYGIEAQALEGGIWQVVGRCSDVTTERQRAEQLARLCNRVCLEPIHLACVVQDFLEDAYPHLE